MSFRSKLMITSILCILLPAILTLSLYNTLTEEAVKKQAVANSQKSLMLVNGYVNNLFRHMLNIANYVQVNSDMKAYFKILTADPSVKVTLDPYTQFQNTKMILQQLDNYAMVFQQLGNNRTVNLRFFVTVFLKDGSSFTNYSTTEYNPSSIVNEPWFGEIQSMKGLQSYWTGTMPTVFETEKLSNPYQISVVRTLTDDNSPSPYGYVVVTLLENQVNQIFQQHLENEEIMLLDREHRIMSHSDKSRIGETVPYVQLTEQNKSWDVVPVEGTDYLVSGLGLPIGDGWQLISTQPYKDAVVNINSIFNRVFLVQLVSFVLFLMLLIYLIRRFTKPLVKLAKTAAAVQRGNLEVRSEVQGNDEVGRLGNSFDQMLDNVKRMIAEISLSESKKRKAELAMLQAQINPHFLFNVLNSIRMKVMHRGDPESAEMVGSLSKLLRMTISQDKDDIPLHDEIELVTDYLKLMNMRQKEKVELFLDIAAEALMVKVPRFCLQPLIENAILHGLDRSAGVIGIQATMEASEVRLTITDDGMGMDETALQELNRKLTVGFSGVDETVGKGRFSSIGLRNVYERMRMTFGEGFDMKVYSEKGAGTRIVMSIPQKEATDDV